jgi:hypothetical protein
VAFVDMFSELSGCVPKIPIDYCKTLVNRAYQDIGRKSLWSYQLFEANWTSPGVVNAGTVTTVQGSNQVTFNATAITAINAIGLFPSSVTQRQFRVGISTIYNIWDWNSVSGVATLDRPFAEASAAATAYTILQCYYVSPVQDFKAWITIRDIQNFNDLELYKNREWLDAHDPQRMIVYLPTHAVYYQTNQNPASNTYRWAMWELWGQPQYQLTYQLYGIRRGAPLVQDSDTLPLCLGEDCVQALAKSYAYEWAEGNKGDIPRGSGSDYRFLMAKAEKDYGRLYKEYRKDDREAVDNWWSFRRPKGWPGNAWGFYNSIAGVANAGVPWAW